MPFADDCAFALDPLNAATVSTWGGNQISSVTPVAGAATSWNTHLDSTSPQYSSSDFYFPVTSGNTRHFHRSGGNLIPATASWVLIMRIKPSVVTSGAYELFAQHTGSAATYCIPRIENGNLRLPLSSSAILVGPAISANTWSTVIFRRNPFAFNISINNGSPSVRVDSSTSIPTAGGNIIGASSGSVGQWDGAGTTLTRQFQGYMGRVALWYLNPVPDDLDKMYDWVNASGVN